jgi:hypothetical protein
MTPTIALLIAVGSPAPTHAPPPRRRPAVSYERGPAWGRDVAADPRNAGHLEHTSPAAQGEAHAAGRERADAMDGQRGRWYVPIQGQFQLGGN